MLKHIIKVLYVVFEVYFISYFYKEAIPLA